MRRHFFQKEDGLLCWTAVGGTEAVDIRPPSLSQAMPARGVQAREWGGTYAAAATPLMHSTAPTRALSAAASAQLTPRKTPREKRVAVDQCTAVYIGGPQGAKFSKAKIKVFETVPLQPATLFSVTSRSFGRMRQPSTNIVTKELHRLAASGRNPTELMFVPASSQRPISSQTTKAVVTVNAHDFQNTFPPGLNSEMNLGVPEVQQLAEQRRRARDSAREAAARDARLKTPLNIDDFMPKVVAQSPRTSMSLAKKAEVAQFHNPDIPLKPSHFGNTWLLPAMIDIDPLNPDDVLEFVPVKVC